ncbi:hypothetical protein [Helicobacter sp. UBA3407]|uniref:hypothetical protein n=1 Tax=Helicobacter sp. UBA3407 TaxID=1946588 RepID=UPI0026145BFD|nr:hypothetical protein [Helicobacter sp. UBA3407]
MKTKKILGILAILGFLSTTTFAEDFLAKLTNGAISDTSEGVRVLSAEEEREVLGGYLFLRSSQYDTYGYARSYAYIVTDGADTYGSAYKVSKELGFDGYLIVAKYRYMNGQKQHYLNYATSNGRTYEFWQYYGKAQQVLKEFRARY